MAIDIDPDQHTISATRSLRKSGSSIVISIPPQMLQTLDLEADDDVELIGDWDSGEITIRRVEDEE